MSKMKEYAASYHKDNDFKSKYSEFLLGIDYSK